MNRKDSFLFLVRKADIKRSIRNINTNKKSFGTYKTTSFLKDFSGYLIFPFSPDGYYPSPDVTSGRVVAHHAIKILNWI